MVPEVADQGNECPACQRNRDDGTHYCSECGRLLAPCLRQVRPENEPKFVPVENREGSVPSTGTSPQGLFQSDGRNSATDERVEKGKVLTCRCGAGLPAEACYCLKCGAKIGDVPPAFRLVRRTNDGSVAGCALPDDMIVIGKDPGCGLVVDNDEYVSRRHARISKTDGMLFLEDLGSANGTFLRVRRPIVLEVGDEIVTGTTVFRLEEGR